jgi:hypothetical protein
MTHKRKGTQQHTNMGHLYVSHPISQKSNQFKHTHLSIAYRTTNTVLVSYKTHKKHTINAMQAECIN